MNHNKLKKIFSYFKYSYKLQIVRYPIQAFASMCSKYSHDESMREKVNYIYLIIYFILDKLISYKEDNDFTKHCCVKFESIKLNPKTTLSKLCNFFDIEFDEILLHETANGDQINGISNTKDFDKSPMFKSYFNFISPYDWMRLEYIIKDYLHYFNYDPRIINKNMQLYNNDEIILMLHDNFKFEKFHFSEKQIKQTMFARELLYKYANKYLNNDILKDISGNECKLCTMIE